MDERRAVVLFQNVLADLQDVIGTQAHEVAIEGRVMEGAQRDAVSDKWLSCRIRVRDYVGSIKEFLVAQAAKRALALICLQHALTEGSLVKSNTDRGGDVRAASACGVFL